MAASHRWDRWDYEGVGLEGELPDTPWPIVRAWVEVAREAGRTGRVHEPDAMAVATVDSEGLPDVRMVLMRFADPAGPGFVSSRHSRKAAQIESTGVIAATIAWTPLYRAIRFRGRAEVMEEAVTQAYWATRPWGSRISAWASQQSHPVTSRDELAAASRAYAQRFPDTGQSDVVPVPPDWVGYRVRATEVEVWAGRPDRLHDRVRYTCADPSDLDTVGAWTHIRLQP